jgi:hypothetical protein
MNRSLYSLSHHFSAMTILAEFNRPIPGITTFPDHCKIPGCFLDSDNFCPWAREEDLASVSRVNAEHQITFHQLSGVFTEMLPAGVATGRYDEPLRPGDKVRSRIGALFCQSCQKVALDIK